MTNVCVRLAWAEATKMFCLFLAFASLQFFFFFFKFISSCLCCLELQKIQLRPDKGVWISSEAEQLWRFAVMSCEGFVSHGGAGPTGLTSPRCFAELWKQEQKQNDGKNVFFDGMLSLLKTFQRHCSPIKLFCAVVVSGSKYVPAVDWRFNEQAVLTSSCCCSEAPCEKEERK